MLSVPAAAALFVLAHPIVQVLFERGAFDAQATIATASALMPFALGLPAFVLIKVFQPGFFAREDTVTPTILAAISVAINIALSLYLFPVLAHAAIAVATSVAAWFNALFLAGILMKRGHFSMNISNWRTHGLILAASLLMAALLWIGNSYVGDLMSNKSQPIIQFGSFCVLLGAGLIAYFVLLQIFGVVRLREFFARLRGKT